MLDARQDHTSVILIGKVIDGGSSIECGGGVPTSSGDISDMDGIDTQVLCPQEAHLLLEMLIHATAD